MDKPNGKKYDPENYYESDSRNQIVNYEGSTNNIPLFFKN